MCSDISIAYSEIHTNALNTYLIFHKRHLFRLLRFIYRSFHLDFMWSAPYSSEQNNSSKLRDPLFLKYMSM